MGIREELAETLKRAYDNKTLLIQYHLRFWESITDALLERYAVVELPEPTCSTGVNTVWIDSLNVVVIPGGRISTSGRVLTADEARRSAAVLLAAAKYSEENA